MSTTVSPYNKNAVGFPLPSNMRRQLARLVERDGERAILERFGLSRIALARCLAGLGIRRGTAALVTIGLDAKSKP